MNVVTVHFIFELWGLLRWVRKDQILNEIKTVSYTYGEGREEAFSPYCDYLYYAPIDTRRGLEIDLSTYNEPYQLISIDGAVDIAIRLPLTLRKATSMLTIIENTKKIIDWEMSRMRPDTDKLPKIFNARGDIVNGFRYLDTIINIDDEPISFGFTPYMVVRSEDMTVRLKEIKPLKSTNTNPYDIPSAIINAYEMAIDYDRMRMIEIAERDIHKSIQMMLSARKEREENMLKVKKVIFNDPATIVFFEDGSKVVVKANDGEAYDPEKGIAMAIAKKALANGDGNYYNTFDKWLTEYYFGTGDKE